MTAELRLDDIHKRWGTTAVLAGVTLHVDAGEVVAVLGRSGSGKTTLLRIVAGLEVPDDGVVRLGGADVTRLRPGERGLGVVFQNDGLLPHLSVAGNIGFALTSRRSPAAEVRDAVGRAAALTGCDHLLHRGPTTLSGGERQRVALARALVRRPRLVLLDEPLSSLDVHDRAALRTDLRAALVSSGATVLYVTHDQGEAFAVADRVAVLDAGVVQQVGDADALYDRPANVRVASFVGAPMMNVVDVEPADEHGDAITARAGPFDVAVPAELADRPLVAGIRPADVAIRAVDAPPSGSARRAIGHVAAVEVVDAGALVQIDVAGIRVRAVVDRAGRPDVGDTVSVAADPCRVHLFDRGTATAVHHPR